MSCLRASSGATRFGVMHQRLKRVGQRCLGSPHGLVNKNQCL